MSKKPFFHFWVALIAVFQLTEFASAQVVFSEWLAGTGTKGWDLVNGMACDNKGDLYITGSYPDTTDKYAYGNRGINSPHIMYVAKFDTTGKLIWKKNLPNKGSGYGSLIVTGKTDELILLGGNFIPTKKEGERNDRTGFYIASLSLEGTVNWIQNFAGSKFDYLTSLITDTVGGEILVTGYFHDTLAIAEEKWVSKGLSDGVLLHFDLNGNLKGAQIFGGKGEDRLNGLAIDSVGNRYIAGTFQQKIQFENKTIFELKNKQDRGLYVTMYDFQGKIVSAEHIAAGKNIRAFSIAHQGNETMVAASFSDIINIGKQKLSSRGGDDIILLCLNQNLGVKWYKQIGGLKKDRPARVICQGREIILTGSFCSSLKIDQQELISAATGSDVFVVSFDKSGNLVWMRSLGGDSDDYPTDMLPASKEYLYVSGSFRGKINVGGKELQSGGAEDVFIARIEPCNLHAPVFKEPEFFCEETTLHLDAGSGFISYNWANGLSHEQVFKVNQAGEYSLQLTASNGCLIFDTVMVIEESGPYVYLGNDTIIADTSRFLLSAGGNYQHCKWSNGTTGPNLLIKGIDLKEGQNKIVANVTNAKGCVDKDEIIITMIRTMPNHVSDLISGSCVVFPNPTEALTTVCFTISFKSLKMTLYDQMGKELAYKVVHDYIANSKMDFNLGTLSKGLYNLYIKTDRGVATKKIVRE